MKRRNSILHINKEMLDKTVSYTIWQVLEELSKNPDNVYKKKSDGVKIFLKEGYLVFNTEFTHIHINDEWVLDVDYLTFEEARKTRKPMRHVSWDGFYSLWATLELLADVKKSERMNEMMDERAWIIKN
jgi:hypothetical protein